MLSDRLCRIGCLLVMLGLGAVREATAQDCPAIVGFANGIYTPRDTAEWSLRVLRTEVNDALERQGRPKLSTDCFLLAWARNNWADILEALNQSLAEHPETLLQWLFGVIPGSAAFETFLVNDLLSSSFETFFPEAAEDLQGHITAYTNAIHSTRKRVILVAHSQGNFFGNSAFQVLDKSLGTMGFSGFVQIPVATPALLSPSALPHVTLFGDIIQWVAAQPANTDTSGTPCIPNPVNPGSPQLPGFNIRVCHEFLRSYLIGASSRTTIVNEIILGIPRAVARNDSYTMVQGSTLTISPPGLLANDTVALRVSPVVEFLPPFPPASLTNTGQGGFVVSLAPNPTFIGTLTLQYLFHTPFGDSNVARVTINVVPP